MARGPRVLRPASVLGYSGIVDLCGSTPGVVPLLLLAGFLDGYALRVPRRDAGVDPWALVLHVHHLAASSAVEV